MQTEPTNKVTNEQKDKALVDYKLHNAAPDDDIKDFDYMNFNSYIGMYDQCSKILEICNLQNHSSMLRWRF